MLSRQKKTTTAEMEKGSNPPKNKQYNLVLPTEVYQEIRIVADKNNLTIIDLLRKFIKLGLWIMAVESRGGSLVLREGKVEKEIVLL